jgi:hypothetical protein
MALGGSSIVGNIRWRRAASVALIAASIWASAPSFATSVNETSPARSLPELSFGDDASPWKDIVVDGDDVERDAKGNA